MKIIHTADIHLDSPLLGVSDAKTRRAELVRALFNLSEYAANNGVSAVIVAGDLFDDKFTTAQTVESVCQIIGSSTAIWYILRGNHGDTKPYERLKTLQNVRFFGDEWTVHRQENVAFIGRELGKNDGENWQKLHTENGCYNILVLHGDIDDNAYGEIDKKAIEKSGASYVALGHRHSFSQLKFGRTKGCYSGVLEPRGFDETDVSGFVLIDTDKDKITFQPQYSRRIETKQLDVSSVTTDLALEQLVLDAVSDVSVRNYLNVEFVGTANSGVRIIPVATNVLQNKFFALRLKDKTTPKLDLEKVQKEVSLRGEFVKLAMQIADESLRAEVLKLGLAALDGEV